MINTKILYQQNRYTISANKYINDTVGRLKILSVLGSKNKRVNVKCGCICGNKIEVTLHNLKTRNTLSCGCLQKDNTSKSRITHGKSKTALYSVWSSMIQRCYDTKTKAYKNYGGRGIKVCDEWRKSFVVFENWALLNGYRKGLNLDRFPDNNGNYEPANCRVATVLQNNNNKRNCKLIEYNGETKTISEWAICMGVNRQALAGRFYRKWSLQDIFTCPYRGLK